MAVAEQLPPETFDLIVNCGDSLVYAPFPNQTLDWLKAHRVISILGNTDKKIIKLLYGKEFRKPASHNKRIMYTSTARALTEQAADYLLSLHKSHTLPLPLDMLTDDPRTAMAGIFHGSPARHHEFLLDTTPEQRFTELAAVHPYRVILTGHSHTPYHREVAATHFINPGSVGRMFDGDPAASCGVLTCQGNDISFDHYRVPYDPAPLLREIRLHKLPAIYEKMYLEGRKLN